jgi:DNA-binding response OmpR family regulator
MAEKILVVDDEISLQETLTYNLEKQGYTVKTTGNGLEALEMARQIKPDLIILDVMLPGLDGFEICRILRSEMSTPVLMLTARDDEIDRVVGLEVGADDYLAKPFSMRELIARVKALLRRIRLDREHVSSVETIQPEAKIMNFGNLCIDMTRREIKINNQVVPFKPKEYELLTFFAQHIGRALSREFILERVWGWDFIGDSRTVDVHVRWLREKIEDDSTNPQRIVTVRGAGYRFEG